MGQYSDLLMALRAVGKREERKTNTNRQNPSLLKRGRLLHPWLWAAKVRLQCWGLKLEPHAIDDILSERIVSWGWDRKPVQTRGSTFVTWWVESLSSLGQGHRTCFFCKTVLNPLDSWDPHGLFLSHVPSWVILLLKLFNPSNKPSFKLHFSSFPCFLVCLHSFIHSSPKKTFTKLVQWVRYCARY